MTLEEIEPFLKKGKLGIIPNWIGYLKYNHGTKQIEFQNNDYIITEKELKNKIINKTDLYYII